MSGRHKRTFILSSRVAIVSNFLLRGTEWLCIYDFALSDFIPHHHAAEKPKSFGALAAAGRADHFVRQDVAFGSGEPAPKTALSLSRVTKKTPRSSRLSGKTIVHVAAIHHHDEAWRPLQGARHADLVSPAIGDYPIAGQTTVLIEKKMQFDGSLGAPELRPIKSRETEIDDGSIQAIRLVLETKGLLLGQLDREGAHGIL
jgi:hypothetical protein